MYNATLKDEYLDRFDKSTEEYNRVYRLFDDVISEFETKFNTDASRFNANQAKLFFDTISNDTALSNTYANDLIKYTSWCRKQKLTDTNAYTNFCFYYNASLKMEYIEQENSRGIGRPDGFLEHIFRDVSEQEVKRNKDVCNFTKTEILGLYDVLNRPSLSSLDVIHGQLRAYTEWCLSRHLVLDSQNHYTEIKRDDYVECINTARQEKSIMDYDTLNNCVLKELPNPCDSFLILALFEGISGRHFTELMNVKYSDFDVTNKTVTLCSGRTIAASSQLIDLAYDASKEMVYYSFGKNLEISFVEADDTIFKSFPNSFDETSEKQKSRRIYGRFNRIMAYVGMEGLRSNDIIISGKIDFINRRCKELGINGHDYLFSDHIQEINDQFGGKLVRSTFEKAYGKYLVQ